ncbi:50S ribosomal protein L22 [Candidatus Poribacteria bacterium]|nr:50S ribosomal protein L22 [Candidatus Poribacteria bacterium]
MGSNAKVRKEAKQNATPATADGRTVISRSITRYVRCSPRKVALVAELIRNKPVRVALETLRFTQRPSAVPAVERALKSARANAVDLVADPDDLIVAEVKVETAPMLKRIRPASMGRAVRVRKRLSHIRVALAES